MARKIRTHSKHSKILALGLLFLSLNFGCTSSPSDYVADEVANDYAGASVSLPSAGGTTPLTEDQFFEQLLGGASNRMDVRLPGYSYFQGVIHADNHITVIGQVRVVGGILGATDPNATVSLYEGAMITSNAHAMAGAGASLTGGPAGMRTRIKNWEEIPNP